MAKDWRIGIWNGVLLAAYFIPSWTLAALKICLAPVRGLYERPNVALAMYVSDHANFAPLQMVRFAWLVALGKCLVVAFFLIFLVLAVREAWKKRGNPDEALAFALALGGIISVLSMMAASASGDFDALRLHASETLLLIGAAIILLVETAAKTVTTDEAPRSRAYYVDRPYT